MTPDARLTPRSATRKRSPTKGRAPKRKKGAPKKAPKKAAKTPKRKAAPKPKPKPKPKKTAAGSQRAPKPKPAPKRTSSRSEAAKRGWRKRKKRQVLIDKIIDRRIERTPGEDDLPLGWTKRREQLRMFEDSEDGGLWRRIVVEFDMTIVQKRRLEILRELDVDMLTKGELADYLAWIADELDADISDVYRMYLGYPVGNERAVD